MACNQQSPAEIAKQEKSIPVFNGIAIVDVNAFNQCIKLFLKMKIRGK